MTGAAANFRSDPHPKRSLLWFPLVICGVVAAVLAARRDRWKVSRRTTPRRHVNFKQRHLAQLKSAICGNNKQVVQKLLGPPPTIAGSQQAANWYYPVDPVTGRALVIEFDG